MHEVSLIESALSIAAKQAKGRIIDRIVLLQGELTCVSGQALQFAFDAVKASKNMPNAELKIEIIKGRAICKQCHEEFKLARLGTPCPNCQSYENEIIAGEELKISSISYEG